MVRRCGSASVGKPSYVSSTAAQEADMRSRIEIEDELDLLTRQMARLVIQASDIDEQLRELDRKERRLHRELEDISK